MLALVFRGTTNAAFNSAVGFQNGTWNGFPTRFARGMAPFTLTPAAYPVQTGQLLTIGQQLDVKQMGAGSGQLRFRMAGGDMEDLGCHTVALSIAAA